MITPSSLDPATPATPVAPATPVGAAALPDPRLPFYICAWFAFTVLSSIYAKLYLSQTHSPLAITTASLAVAALANAPSLRKTPVFSLAQIVPVAVLHFFAVYLTYTSFAATEVWFTYSVKALEPLSTAVVAWVLTGREATATHFIFLVFITLGVFMTTIKNGTRVSDTVTSLGFIAALISNLSCSIRSVLAKDTMELARARHPLATGLARTFFLDMSSVAAIISFSLWSFSIIFAPSSLTKNGLLQLAVASSTHALYYLFSFQSLGILQPTSHAIANSMKRIFTTVAPAIYFANHLLLLNWVGVGVSSVAAYGYAVHRNASLVSKKVLLLALSLTVVTAAGVILSSPSFLHYTSAASDPQIAPMLHHNRECIASVQHRLFNQLSPHIQNVKKVVFCGPPRHGNLGDSLIWLGGVRLLAMFNLEPVYLCEFVKSSSPYAADNEECFRDQAILKQLNYSSPWEGLAWLNGGGNWGTLWPHEHTGRPRFINRMIKLKVRVVIGPQSAYFHELETPEDPLFQRDKKEMLDGLDFEDAKKIVFCHRWTHSYEFFAANFPEITNLLSPDNAFSIGPLIPPPNIVMHKNIVFLLRRDIESNLGSGVDGTVADALLAAGVTEEDDLTYEVLDWNWLSHVYDMKNNRPELAYQPLVRTNVAQQVLGIGDVVITDRLHASVLALLTNKPHFYIDTIQGKIAGTRNSSLVGEQCSPDRVRGWQVHSMEEAVRGALEIIRAGDIE